MMTQSQEKFFSSANRGSWLLGFVLLLIAVALGSFAYVIWRYEFNETQLKLDRQLQKQTAQMRSAILTDFRAFQVSGTAPDLAEILYPVAQRIGVERKSLVLVQLYRPESPVRTLHAQPGDAIQELMQAKLTPDAAAASQAAIRRSEVSFSPTYFFAYGSDPTDRKGFEVIEAWLPIQGLATEQGAIARIRFVFKLNEVLNDYMASDFVRENELTIRETDGTVLTWGPGLARGAGVFKSSAVIDLPGYPLMLYANYEDDGPRLIPNLLYALLGLLALCLTGSLLLLLRDNRRRAVAEQQLRRAFEFRKAMEDSLITGLRARDLEGKVTYVNRAFCDMVGYSPNEIVGRPPPMPYWAPESRDEYERRYAEVVAGTVSTEGFETVFMRRDGTRFPALIYEAPLVDDRGRQTGWMGSILDLSERRAIEEVNRNQQAKLERASRFSTMGELASVLAHELNQPLSAIASYASGAQNLLDTTPAAALKDVLGTIQVQAQRAGAIVHRMHDFVRQRGEQREVIDLVATVLALEPLLTMQARGSLVKVEFQSAIEQVHVLADRVLIEQVILNITRNAIQALDQVAQPIPSIAAQSDAMFIQPQLGIEVSEVTEAELRLAQVSITDNGPGVDAEILEQLFSAYVTTKSEGMGIGLNICRSVVERIGGKLWHERPESGGARFVFTIPIHAVEFEQERG
jgi:two-component system, LuxR family, sensor histidine kinase DctS